MSLSLSCLCLVTFGDALAIVFLIITSNPTAGSTKEEAMGMRTVLDCMLPQNFDALLVFTNLVPSALVEDLQSTALRPTQPTCSTEMQQPITFTIFQMLHSVQCVLWHFSHI